MESSSASMKKWVREPSPDPFDPILRDIDDIFGKDSVWFTEKGKDGNSNLFSLVEFRGLNKLSSIHRAYMNGQFGALPNIIM